MGMAWEGEPSSRRGRPATETLTSWAVVERLRPGRGRTLTVPRLIVSGVPPRLRRAEVLEALDAAGAGARFSVAGVPWANHRVLPEGQWPEVWDRIGSPPDRWSWDQLTAPQGGRVVSLRLSAAEHATAAIAAARLGLTLQDWGRRALLNAAGVEGAPTDALALSRGGVRVRRTDG